MADWVVLVEWPARTPGEENGSRRPGAGGLVRSRQSGDEAKSMKKADEDEKSPDLPTSRELIERFEAAYNAIDRFLRHKLGRDNQVSLGRTGSGHIPLDSTARAGRLRLGSGNISVD